MHVKERKFSRISYDLIVQLIAMLKLLNFGVGHTNIKSKIYNGTITFNKNHTPQTDQWTKFSRLKQCQYINYKKLINALV